MAIIWFGDDARGALQHNRWFARNLRFAVHSCACADEQDVDRATATQHRLIGICETGFEVLYQPVACRTMRMLRRSGSVEFQAACQIKDYPVKRFPVKLLLKGTDTITFNEKDFPADYFSLSGTYLRCNREFKCEPR